MKKIGVLRAVLDRNANMPAEFARSLQGAIAQVWRDERGVSAVIIALSLTVLVGFAGLGVDTGLWYSIKRQNQSAADAAALSAAYEILAGNTNVSTYLTPAATRAATQNGYTGTTPVVTYPYSDSIVSNAVAVTLHTTQAGLLSALFLPSVTIETKAVANVFPAAPGCILTLGTTGYGFEDKGSSTLNAPDCSVMAASTSDCAINDHDAGGSITVKALITAGQVSSGQGCNVVNPTNPPSNMQANLMTGVASQQFIDPYGSTSGTTSFTNSCSSNSYLTHAFLTCNIPSPEPGACTASPAQNSGTMVAGGVRFCDGLSIKKATVDLVPSGGIGFVSVVNKGSGYSSGTPIVTFTGGGGSGAAATATVQGNKVQAINVTSPGSGYTSAPTITISGGGGSGATATATVSNGVIWITDGDLALDSNGVLECTTCNTSTGVGVTIIFTTTSGGSIGAPTMQSNPTIDNLSAPTSGTYAGLLMVQDTVSGASYTTTATFQGTPGQTLNGLIYTPNSQLNFIGNPSVTNSCLLVVAQSLILNGNSSLATGGCPNTFPLPEVKNVALAS